MNHTTKQPNFLEKGSTIGIVCTSGFLAIEKTTNCIQTLQSWGFTVVLGKTVGLQNNYFAGTDNDRLKDLQEMLDNKNINAILCGRGGYGMSRIIDSLNFEKFKQHPKWIIGFSDITLLLNHLYNKVRYSSMHAPMVNAFNTNNPVYINSIKEILFGNKMNYKFAGSRYNITGKADGIIIGGNLTMLAHSVGTVSFFKPSKNYILFIEDIGEHLYAIDRLLTQLNRTGLLQNLKALIVGGFTDLKDTDIPFGKNIYELVLNIVEKYNYPVCFDFPISHNIENIAIKVGVECRLNITKEQVNLLEL
jgi:muramoyltetrapeptide carboxypeptidase